VGGVRRPFDAGLEIDRAARPHPLGPRPRHLDDGVVEVEPEVDGGPLRSPGRDGPGCRGRGGDDARQIRLAVGIEDDVELGPGDVEPPQVTAGEQHRRQAVAPLDPFDRKRGARAVAGLDAHVFKHRRHQPTEPHTTERDVGPQRRQRPGDERRKPRRLAEQPRGDAQRHHRDTGQKEGDLADAAEFSPGGRRPMCRTAARRGPCGGLGLGGDGIGHGALLLAGRSRRTGALPPGIRGNPHRTFRW